MRARERTTADSGVANEAIRIERLDRGLHLHVAELADVELAARIVARPSEEDVGRRLHRPLSDDDALAMAREEAPAGVGLQDRGARFLQLQEERVFPAREEEADAAERADAAD